MPSPPASVEDAWRSFLDGPAADDVASLLADYPAERSLHVDVVDLHRHDPDLAEALFAAPDEVLERAAALLRSADEDVERVNVRLRNLPSQLGVGSVGARHASTLVTVEGVVASSGPVEATVATGVYGCADCGAAVRLRPRGIEADGPDRCGTCESTGPFALDRDRTRFVDLQRVELAESADDGAGRTLDAYLDDDLVGAVAPEDRVSLTGVVRLRRRGEANRFARYLDALAVEAGLAGAQREAVDAPQQLKESIRSRWEFVVDR